MEQGSSRLFGDRYPVARLGKFWFLDVAKEFSREFDERRRAFLDGNNLSPDQIQPIRAVGAYPSRAQQLPCLSVVLLPSSVRFTSLSGHVDTSPVPGTDMVRRAVANEVRDQVEVTLCTLNPVQRDEISLWFKQYILDAVQWALPELRDGSGVIDMGVSSYQDDLVEYEGTRETPGFQFYVARFQCYMTYEIYVHEDVDKLSSIINWVALASPSEAEETQTQVDYAGVSGDGSSILSPVPPFYP